MTTHRWMDAAACGEFFSVSARHFRERVSLLPGFPAPLRGGGTGAPLWPSDEVAKWADRERERHAGASRRAAIEAGDSR